MMGIFDRLAQGPGNVQPEDYQDWNQMVGSAPPEQFGRAAYSSIRQVDPQEYYQHSQPGIGGTDPFGSLQPQQRSGLAESLLGNLFNRGVDQQQVMQGAGVRSLDPSRMSAQDLAAVSQWTQQNHPQAFGRTAAQYQQQPDLLHSLLGNKALMLTAAAVGAKFLADRSRQG
jgi:hypothetical protein